MPSGRVIVGNVTVSALLDLEIDEAPIVESFPDVPADRLLAEKARFPGVYGADDAWRLRVRAWLVRHPGGLLLFDTGVGGSNSPAMSWTGRPGALGAELRAAGISPADVDVVVVSHAHDDHVGGAVDDGGKPAFPNARHLVQRAEWDWVRRLAREDEDAAGSLERLFAPLDGAGLVELLDGHHRLTDLMELRQAPGHTPGHQMLRIVAHDRRLLITADAFNHPAQVGHPRWPSGTDDDPATATETRRGILAELLSHPGSLAAPTHFAEAFGRIGSDRAGLAEWQPVDPDE